MARIIKCLTIQEPWLTLILRKVKPVENRTRKTKYRGELGLHCGKTFDLQGYRALIKKMPHIMHVLGPLAGWIKNPKTINTNFVRGTECVQPWAGNLVGTCRLADCVARHGSMFFTGPFGYVLEDVIRLAEPFPVRGKQGFFDVLLREHHEQGCKA